MKYIFELEFTIKTIDEIVNSVIFNDSSKDFKMLVTTNLDHIVMMSNNKSFKHACERAWIVTADGFPVYRFLKLLGHDAKGRITGADLFPLIMSKLSPIEHSPFFVVSSEDTKRVLVDWLVKHDFSDSHCRVVVPPFGFEHESIYSHELINSINHLATTHLFMGVGAPKSELWMDSHRNFLKGVKGFGFGAGIDFYAGTMKRAPLWMQTSGLEWFYRLSSEPRRLAKRYLFSSWMFLFIATKEYIKLKK
ncbi:WecB/TagA/CpsF family glycosyltransferase [Shewanella frigidimarina]|uniref:WecB/TagA/CpsF family glycosyltransferase n=1 Tax=Shewanella frigidimarina TaxID=56812 RepID=UPI00317C308C